MTLIADLVAAGPTLSVEFFPPRTDEGVAQLHATVEALAPANLSFVSVTYGAGGSTRELTRDLVVGLNADQPYPAMAHLTCVGHRREQLDELLDDYADHGVHNLLALFGDPPADGSDPGGDFSHAIELVELVRAHSTPMTVAVAAHPEGHPRSPDLATDRRFLAQKLAAADMGITQFFFDADDYFRMVEDLAALGCDTPVLPGVMPLANPATIRRFGDIAGTTFPVALAERVEAAEGADRHRVIVDAAAELSQRLLDGGAPGLHLYCLNRAEIALDVLSALGPWR
ncbi:MAG: methylenetetrahydrofolate reductase [Actinomycetes bacterium]